MYKKKNEEDTKSETKWVTEAERERQLSWSSETFLHERELFVFDKRRKKDRMRSKKDRSGRSRESNLRRAAPSRDGSCSTEFTQPIHQLKTMNARHRNERLAVLLAAFNKWPHSCPRHRCSEKFISHQSGLSRPTLLKLCPLSCCFRGAVI